MRYRLDVYYKSGNFIDQFQRSYSHTASISSECGRRSSPPSRNVTLTQLHTIDEVPYPAAVSARVKLVMVSWAIYPALDPSLPAGLSPTVIGQELRGRNNFTGVTITDALEAGALNAFGSTRCGPACSKW